VLRIVKASLAKLLLVYGNHLWERGAIILGFAFLVFFPRFASYSFAPYITARVFEKNELPSLTIFALLGFILDAIGETFFFGFFTLSLPVIGAFIYSLNHFFRLNRASAFGFCFISNFILASAKVIYTSFFLETGHLFLSTLFTELIAAPLLFAFICMRLYMAQPSLLSKKS